MQLRDLAESKRDLLMFDPRKIQVEPGYNIRDLSTDEAQSKLHDLARSIASIGVQDPLTVRLKGEQVFVVAGHRRLAAMIAIEGGAEIKTIPCIAEPVRSGEVSPSTAREVVRKHGDRAGETLANAKRQAASEGKSRVTTAHVKASTGEFQASAGNIKIMIGALELIAKDGDGDAAEIARDALEKIGVLKKTNGAAAGHRVAAE